MTTTPIDRGAAWRAAIVLVPLFQLLGGLAARVSGTTEANPWFQTLTQPQLQPPGFVFGIAWAILYTMMAVSAALVWAHKGAPGRGGALALFTLQWLLNLAWSPLYFRLHQILPAFALILIILAVTIATAFAFGRISRVAAWLLVPYMVWLGFAAGLNFRTWQLNPGAAAPIEALFGG